MQHITLLRQGQIQLGPIPRKCLEANVTRKRLVSRKSGVSGVSPTSYEEVTRNWSQWNLAYMLMST